MKDVTISTERVILKSPVGVVSPEEMAEAMAHPDTVRYMSAIPTMDYKGDDAESFLRYLAATAEDPSQLQLGVFLKDVGRFIGMCSLENIDHKTHSCELGYWLCRDYVGQGLMQESAKALLGYAKDFLGIKQADAFVICEHERSISLLERLGFSREELLKGDVINKGVPADRYRYALSI